MAYAREIAPGAGAGMPSARVARRRLPQGRRMRPTPRVAGPAARIAIVRLAGARRSVLRVPGRPRQAVGCGSRVGRARASAARAGRHSAGRHDTLRPRLHLVDARAERSGRQMCARRSSRGTQIRPRRISVEQLSDEPWGRRRPRLRRLCGGLRPRDHAIPARALAGQREDAEHLAGRPAGRARVPEPSVHNDRRCRGGRVRGADLHPEHRCSGRLFDRSDPLRLDRLHRHERVGALQRARRRGGQGRRLAGAKGRVPRRRDHRPARGRARAARRLRLLRRAYIDLQRQPQDCSGRADRPRLRRLADLCVREARRRHLHEGRRRRRRPRR